MRRLVAFGLLCALGGCAVLPVPFGGPPPTTAPATPVFFQPFSANLDPAALSAIASVAVTAKQRPGVRVIVTGAADATGSALANKFLSKTRAQVVADALEADGVAPGRIRIRGIGVAVSPSVAGMQAQSARRVLIQLAG